MAEVQLIKQPGGLLRPANQADADALEKIGNGRLLLADIKQPRNPLFHRKFFALLNLAFEYWNPGPVEVYGKEIEVAKSFERFRKDMLIIAGFRTVVVNVKNEARYEAQSISFGSMDETRFHEVYRAVFSACWRLVLSKVEGMTEAKVQQVVDELLRFD
jgi:hypothetical protein